MYKAVAGLQEGDVSDVIKMDNGLHIIKMAKKDPARQLTFEEARPLLENELRMSLADNRKKAWEHELRKDAKIEITPGMGLGDEAAKPQEK